MENMEENSNLAPQIFTFPKCFFVFTPDIRISARLVMEFSMEH